MTRMAEPEWDDLTRHQAEALAEMERDSCPGCGLHSSILDDPEHNRFSFEERVCEVCKGQHMYGRMVADRDKRATERMGNAPPNIPRPGDGRHIYLTKRHDD